jgi:hypothetical protein
MKDTHGWTLQHKFNLEMKELKEKEKKMEKEISPVEISLEYEI